ncbi:MAG TPA: MDR family MFS transporter [Trueperaceae bacterium]|nr:MDR family MFS transporter [Trueperaceae bacterium]
MPHTRLRSATGHRAGRRDPQPTNRITGNARWWALGAVMLAMFFASLDQTVVSTALPVIVGDLHGLHIYAWVFTAYMMASAITVPIYGKLSDIYGRKPFYLGGLVLFMLGSAASGQAHTMMELILARGLQGVGAGALMSMPRATIGDIFNPRERGRWMGAMSGVFGVSAIVGPTMGGFITDHWGWRWVFYVNLPVAAAVGVAVLLTLPRVRAAGRVHVDWRGSLLLALGLVPLLLGFTWAGGEYSWGSPVVLGLFAVAVAFLGLFVLDERRAAEPILDPALFSRPIFTVTSVIALFVTMAMFGGLMFLPLYVQGVLGFSAQGSGEILTPMMLGFVAGSVLGGVLMTRTGRYKVLAVVAAMVMVAGMVLFNRMGLTTPWPVVVRNMVVAGVGVGTLLPLLNVVVQNAFPYEIMGVVNATQQFVRSLGGVIIAPILGSVLARGFGGAFQGALPLALRLVLRLLPPEQRAVLNDPQSLISQQAQTAIHTAFARFGAQGDTFYTQFLRAVRAGLDHGMQAVFLVGLIVAVLALVTAFFLPEAPLKRDEFFRGEPADAGGRDPGAPPAA